MWNSKGFEAFVTNAALTAGAFCAGLFSAALGDIGSLPLYHGGWMLIWNTIYLGLGTLFSASMPAGGQCGLPALRIFVGSATVLGFLVVCAIEWVSRGQHCTGSGFDLAMSLVTLFWLPAALGLWSLWLELRGATKVKPEAQ